MKSLIISILITLFLVLAIPSSQAATVTIYPDGSRTVNLATYDLGTNYYHAQVDFTASGVDYITVINPVGNAFAWGYVERDGYGNKYLYISDDGYNYYYCP